MPRYRNGSHSPSNQDGNGGESTSLLHANSQTPENYSTAYRLFIITLAILVSLLTSGVIFGWPPLLLVLQSEGIYADSCPVDEPDRCPEQIEKLNLIFVLASTFFSCCVLPLGVFLDWAGPRLSCALGSVLFLAGTILFAFSSNEFDAFIYGYILIGVSGPPIVFSFLHLSNLFPRQKGMIITLFNVALDASSLDFFLLELLNESFGITHREFFLGYAVIPVLILVTIWLWPSRSYLAPVASEADTAKGKTAASQAHKVVDYHIADFYSEHSFKDQLWNTTFIFGAVFTALQLLRINFYIGTVEYQLEDIDKDQYDLFTQIFSVVLPVGGIIVAPVVGWLLDKKGIVISVAVLVASGVIYGILGLLTHASIWIQLFTFGVVAFYRAILFSGMAHYVALWFGFRNFGKLWGLVFFFAGVVNLGIYFLVRMINDVFEGHFFYPNLLLTILAGLLFGFVIWLWKKSKSVRYDVLADADSSEEEKKLEEEDS